MITDYEQKVNREKAQVLADQYSPDLDSLRGVRLNSFTVMYTKNKTATDEELRNDWFKRYKKANKAGPMRPGV